MRASMWSRVASVALVVASISGCSADVRAPGSPMVLLDQVVAYECDHLVQAGSFGFGFATYASLCVTGRDPSLRRVRDAVASGQLAIDPSAMARCFASGENVAFEDVFALGTTCAAMWVPQTPIGGACDTSLACIDGYCARSDYARSRPDYVAGGCGVCVARGDVGAICQGHGWEGMDWECRAGLVCDAVDGSTPGHCISTRIGDACPTGTCTEGVCSGGRCVAIVPLGMPCSGAEVCGPHADCIGHCPSGVDCEIDGTTCGSATCSGTICVPEGTLGQTCDVDHDCDTDLTCRHGVCDMGALVGQPCAGTFCAPHLACSSTASDAVCVGPVAHGQTCISSAQCPEGSSCDQVCFAWIRQHEACDPGGIDRCVPGTGCIAGVCEALPDLGAPCTVGCNRGVCSRGTCVSPPVGTPCQLGDPTCGANVCAIETNTCELPPTTCMGWDACPLESFCSSAMTCMSICYLGP